MSNKNSSNSYPPLQSEGAPPKPFNSSPASPVVPAPHKRSLSFLWGIPIGILLGLVVLSLFYKFTNFGKERVAEETIQDLAAFENADILALHSERNGYKAALSSDAFLYPQLAEATPKNRSFVKISFEYQIEMEKGQRQTDKESKGSLNENDISLSDKLNKNAANENDISLSDKLAQNGAPVKELTETEKLVQNVLNKNNLTNAKVKIVLVMDISSSMDSVYEKGRAQGIINKTIPLAMQIKDKGDLQMDFWYFGEMPKKMQPITLKNYKNFISKSWKSVAKSHGATTDQYEIMKPLIEEYGQSHIPVYVIFITDGDFNIPKDMKVLITQASGLPIFFEFLGLCDDSDPSQRGYKHLEILDTMSGRVLDNADFFIVDNFKKMSDETLYNKLLQEFPSWLAAAQKQGVVKS